MGSWWWWNSLCLRYSGDVVVGDWWVWCGEEVFLALDLMKVSVNGMFTFEHKLSAPTPPVVRHIKASRSVLGALTFLLAGSSQHLPFLICAQPPSLPLRLMHKGHDGFAGHAFAFDPVYFCYWELNSWTLSLHLDKVGIFCLLALCENLSREVLAAEEAIMANLLVA